MARTSACDDCLVTFLCGDADTADAPLALNDEEADTIRLFQDAGLAPALRHVAFTSRLFAAR